MITILTHRSKLRGYHAQTRLRLTQMPRKGVGAPTAGVAAALVFLLAASGAPTAGAQWMWNIGDIQSYMKVRPH